MFFILLFYFRKMFIGGLSWQTTPGKNFLLGLFQTFFKELKLFNIPFDKKKAINDIGMDSNRKGIWIEIKVFYFDYVGLSIRQNPKSTFFKCEKYLLTWICFSILEIINLNSYGWIPERRWLQVEVTSIWMWKWPMYLRNNIF